MKKRVFLLVRPSMQALPSTIWVFPERLPCVLLSLSQRFRTGYPLLYVMVFQKIYFLNGHRGNVPSLGASFSEAYMPYSLRGDPCPFALDFKNWWLLPGMMSFFEEIFEDGLGVHATPWEVAVTYYARPHAQKSVKMTPRIAPGGPIRDAVDYQRRFPDGRVASDPAQASVEKWTCHCQLCEKSSDQRS